MTYDYPLKIGDAPKIKMNVSDDNVALHVEAGIAVARPAFPGPYVVTPSSEAQTLETANMTTTENIIINPVPSNYGLITWNGSFLTVS